MSKHKYKDDDGRIWFECTVYLRGNYFSTYLIGSERTRTMAEMVAASRARDDGASGTIRVRSYKTRRKQVSTHA